MMSISGKGGKKIGLSGFKEVWVEISNFPLPQPLKATNDTCKTAQITFVKTQQNAVADLRKLDHVTPFNLF